MWKKYKSAQALLEAGKKYELSEAIALAKKVSYVKFDATIEIHLNTAANPKYQDQIIRSTVVLPNWIWKSKKIAVYATEDNHKAAKDAGADIVGSSELLKDIENWKIDFEVLITTPDMIKDLAKVAKVLWPKGLMPSPKAGTISNDLTSTINEIKKWRVEFKLDKTWNIHVWIWKVSFDDEKLVENAKALLAAIDENKPSWVKWKLIRKAVLAPTMGPGVEVEL